MCKFKFVRFLFLSLKLNCHFNNILIYVFVSIALLEQKISSALDKTDPADVEDCAFKAEYKDKDGLLLHAAAKSGDIEIIQSLLSQGFQVDSRDREGVTPLMCTASNNHQVAFQMLIQNGANPALNSNNGSSLLHFAAEGGNTSIINKLLSFGLDIDLGTSDGFTPLMTAAYSGEQSAFEMLIQNHADPHLKDSNGFCLLHHAAASGNTSIMNDLLSLGLDVDSRSNYDVTPLMGAAAFGNESAFHMLIQKGAVPSLNSYCSTLLQMLEIHPLSLNTWY